jgi:hypothetical protein
VTLPVVVDSNGAAVAGLDMGSTTDVDVDVLPCAETLAVVIVSAVAALFMELQACAPETARPSEAASNSSLVILVILRFMRRTQDIRPTGFDKSRFA